MHTCWNELEDKGSMKEQLFPFCNGRSDSLEVGDGSTSSLRSACTRGCYFCRDAELRSLEGSMCMRDYWGRGGL